MIDRFRTPALCILAATAATALAHSAANAQNQAAPPISGQIGPGTSRSALRLDMPHSWNPLDAYRAQFVPQPNLANSSRLDSLTHNGVLELSLSDAIALALENNLDLEIARYNIPIAQADLLRTKAGGIFRGVNTGVVQNTPGGGVGGFGQGSGGAGAGGTTGGAGGAGTGASGLVQSTLGIGAPVSSYDPTLVGNIFVHHNTQPLSNTSIYGVQTLHSNVIAADFGLSQAFPTGTTASLTFNNDRTTTNSPFTFLNPQLDSYYQVLIQQQLLSGFGLGPNLRYLRIARNNQKISNEAFKLQVITTVTQIANMYWDLVSAYEDEQVKSRSLDFANQTLDSARKQLELQAIPAMDVMKDEAEVASRDQDLSIARSTLQFQELLIKNALTKNLDDPILEAMPVHPTDLSAIGALINSSEGPAAGAHDVMADALSHRVELSESALDLKNREISRAAARNALLPTVDLVAYYGGSGLGGNSNPAAGVVSTAPGGFSGAFGNAFNNTSPDYYVGLNLNVPIRNRIAKSDQYRSELEARQAELRTQELRKQIRIEVRNAQYALAQSQARVTFATKGRDLAQRTFEISTKEQALGAGSAIQTLTARHDLANAESVLVAARTAFQKARIELDRATGSTLEANSISLDSARASLQQ